MKEEFFPVSYEKYVPQYIKKGMKSCSTPAHYYDRNKADKFDVLFGCTSIGDNPTVEHNKYIVIRYDFSKMSMSKDKVELEPYFNLLNSGAARVAVAQNRDIFGDFTFHSDGNASQMLREIMDYVSSHNLPPLYILIDFLAKSLK